MPAKSQQQQKFMGMVHALNKGDIKPSDVSKSVRDVAKNIKKSDAKDFASTKHNKIPKKVKQEILNALKEYANKMSGNKHGGSGSYGYAPQKGLRDDDGYTNEASRGQIHKAVKKGSFPITIVVVKNGKVIHQELVKTPEAVPASFNVIQKKYKGTKIHIEDKTGKIIFKESVNEGPIDRVVGGRPYKYVGDGRKGKVTVSGPMKDRERKDILKRAKKAGYSAAPGIKGGVVIHVESVNERMDKRQAGELIKQLGGNRFIAMTGAKNFVVGPKGAGFKIGKNSKGINYVRIDLDGRDLYNMEFIQARGGNMKVKSKEKGVYFDQLRKLFTKNTGMYTTLEEGKIPQPIQNLIDDMVKNKIQRRSVRIKSKSGLARFMKDVKPALKDKLLTIKHNPIDKDELFISLGPKSIKESKGVPQNYMQGRTSDYHTALRGKNRDYSGGTNFKKTNHGQPDIENAEEDEEVGLTNKQTKIETPKSLSEKFKVAGRPVKINKGKKKNGTDWTVTFKNGKTVPLSDVLSLIKPLPKLTKEEMDNLSSSERIELYKLYSKAMKAMPGSPNQKKIKVLINKLRKKADLKPLPINEVKVETERYFGKKGIIIMIRDGNKLISAIFKDKKNADKFNRNKPSDVKKLYQLAKKTKFPKTIDEYGQRLDLSFIDDKEARLKGTPEPKDAIDRDIEEYSGGSYEYTKGDQYGQNSVNEIGVFPVQNYVQGIIPSNFIDTTTRQKKERLKSTLRDLKNTLNHFWKQHKIPYRIR